MSEGTDCDAGLHQWSTWMYGLNNDVDYRYCYNCGMGMTRYRANK